MAVELSEDLMKQLSEHYDVVIVGAGSAGLVSALELTERGKKVIILEKMDRPGGNSMRASSGMNAAETEVQKSLKIEDSYQKFYDDTFQGGGKLNDPERLSFFVKNANNAIEWLKQHDIVLDELTLTGGMSVKRTHRPSEAPAIGGYLINHLIDKLAIHKVPLICQANVTNINHEDEEMSVKVRISEGSLHNLKTSNVILATGGFSASHGLIKAYRPDLLDYKTTNQPGATGDGLRLAEELGAQVIDLDQIQVHPTVYQDQKRVFLIGETVRGEGAILVNQEGKRFVNELDTRQVVTDAINQQTLAKAYLVFNQNLVDRVKAVQFYHHIGLTKTGDTLDELAKKIDVPLDNLKQTIEQWKVTVKNQEDTEFCRKLGMIDGFEMGPFLAIPIAPAIHYTMGGLKTNVETQVLNQHNQPIQGLYAAGEVVGGLHGNNRIGGNSIAETVVFGLKAAEQIL